MDITQFYTTFLTIERNPDGSFARVKDGSTGELQKVVRFPEKWSETKSKKTMIELATHFSKWNAAIAIITGKINDITVIDFDSKDNELIAQLYMESPTLMVETEKGFHLYYKYNSDQSLFQTGTNRFGQKVDCRNDGGLIFAPPTPNYDVFYDEDIAEITEGGIELLKASRGNLPIQSIFDKPRPTETTSRNDTLFRMACGWVESYDDQEVWNRCVSMNKNFKKGELDARELEAVYQQALKYKNRSTKAAENVNTHASTNATQKPLQQSPVASGEVLEQYSWVTMTDVLERASQDLENTDPNDIISFGYKFIDDMITGIFPGDMAVIGGESGCLHKNTRIYDPIKKTNLTVYERFVLGEKFHVYSLDKGKCIIAEAEAPREFFSTKMYELTNGEDSITVTGKHRIWDGESYVEVRKLMQSSSFLLPTISESFLSKSLLNVHYLCNKVSDSLSYCRSLFRLCDQQLHIYLGIFRYFSQPLVDVLERIQQKIGLDVFSSKLKCSRLCLQSYPLGKLDFSFLENKNYLSVLVYYLTVSISLLSSQLHSLSGKFYSYLFLLNKGLSTVLSAIQTKASCTYQDYFHSYDMYNKLHSNYTTWEVKQKEDDIYYDFTVPVYENYYSNGLFHHNSGKTSFATNIIYKASKTKKCAVFALEDRLNDYGIKSIFFDINRQRMLKNLYQYDWNQYRRNEIKTEEYYSELENAKKSLANDNVLFINDVTEMITIESLELMIEQKVNEGVKLFLLDHLHYLDLTRGKQSKSDYIEQVITRLKSVINRTGTSLLLIVHYKKLEGKKPTLDSFKDSISIVQNANYVISLWRDRNALQEGTRCDTTFFIPKARNPNGEGSTMARFNKETNDYEQWDNWQEEVLKKSQESKKQPLRF